MATAAAARLVLRSIGVSWFVEVGRACRANLAIRWQRPGTCRRDQPGDGAAGGVTAGSRMRTVVPSPGAVRSSTRPLWAWVIASTIDRPEARTALVAGARRVGPVEALERLLRHLGRHAGTLVLHLDDRFRAVQVRPDPHGGVGRRVHERVADEVGHHLAQPAVVPGDDHGRRRRRPRRSARGATAWASATASRASAARSTGPWSSGRPWSRRASRSRSSMRLPMRTASCSVRRMASASACGSLEATGAVELGVAPDGRDRRAQLVRRVGHEPAQPVLGAGALVERLLDAAQHLVQRQPELARLGAGGHLGHPLGEVAARDRGGGGGHLLHRPHAEAEHPVGHEREQRRARRRSR